MEKTRILPGDLLVSKGALKISSSLPEIGLKDVSPNGSWLEKKETLAALEARKQLIAVERIEKSGVLSHAEWCAQTWRAEVTQKVGGYWQYLGYNVGKQLYLRPEEALFLMEINCLLLKYKGVKVSLQQAYALLLGDTITLMQYKVYASLSRLGHRVFRHTKLDCTSTEVTNIGGKHSNSTSFANENNVQENYISKNNVCETDKDVSIPKDNDASLNEALNNGTDIKNHERYKNLNASTYITELAQQPSTSQSCKKAEMKQNKLKGSRYIENKINKLKCRKLNTKQCGGNDYFKNIPDFTKSTIVEMIAPNILYLPTGVNFNKYTYRLNVEKIQTKSTSPEEATETSSSPNDSMTSVYQNNANHSRHPPPQNHHYYRGNNWTGYSNYRFAPQPNPFRAFNFWRPQTNLNYYEFNMNFQRPPLYPQFGPRFMLNPLSSSNMNFYSNSYDNTRKKRNKRDIKRDHYASIQSLASIIRNSVHEFDLLNHSVSKLNHLIQTFNTRYRTRLRVSNDFHIIIDENIIETIEVDDDDEPIAKKANKYENPEDAFNVRLQKLQQLAFKLKNMEMKNEATSRQRRVLAHAMKTFNTCYEVDYYVNDYYDVVNRNDLTLLDSSDSDSVSETSAPPNKKKLKNPFSILKQFSEKQISEEKYVHMADLTEKCPFRYSELTRETFKNRWLPEESDFGRAEIISTDNSSEVINMRREEFLFDFLKIQPHKFKNWLDIKISLLKCLQETCELNYDVRQRDNGLESLVKPEEFNNTSLVLQKLSIFRNHEAISVNDNLSIDFDVYNRNVQNFKKTNRPLPHFRVICIRESSILPPGKDVASLLSKYKDNVPIIFAVVGSGSISYLQVNPTDLPVYKPKPIK